MQSVVVEQTNALTHLPVATLHWVPKPSQQMRSPSPQFVLDVHCTHRAPMQRRAGPQSSSTVSVVHSPPPISSQWPVTALQTSSSGQASAGYSDARSHPPRSSTQNPLAGSHLSPAPHCEDWVQGWAPPTS